MHQPLAPTLCIALAGDAAAAVLVRRSPLGATAQTLGVVADARGRTPADMRTALGLASAPANAPLIVVLPPSLCALRPIGLDKRGFTSARGELAAASSDLFPFPPGEVDLGFIELTDTDAPTPQRATDAEDTGPGGCIVAAHTPRLDAVLAPVVEAAGRTPAAVISPHMALLGLGLQSEPRATVLETSPLGQTLSHEFAYGLPARLAVASQDTATIAPAFRLPDDRTPDLASLTQLAQAGALAPRIAPGAFAPLRGRTPSPALRWLPPAGLAASAAALAAAAVFIADARYAAAADRALAEQEAIAAAVREARADAAELERLTDVLENASQLRLTNNDGVFEAFAGVVALLPDDSFVSLVDITPDDVRIEGGAVQAQQVLRAVERSPMFESARQNGSYLPLDNDAFADWESFNLSAQRSESPQTTGEPRSSEGVR